jgi:DNA-binding MarR family transcriptional regulator
MDRESAGRNHIIGQVDSGELFRLGRRLMELARAASSDPDDPSVPQGELAIISDLHAHPVTTVTEIRGRTGFAQSYVSAVVENMRTRGHVTKVADAADGRRTMIEVHPGILEVIRSRSLRPIDGVLSKALPGADPATIESLKKCLETLAAALLPQA